MSAGSGFNQGGSGGGGGGGNLTPTNILYSNLLSLYNAGTMVPGWYNITDRADQGIVIEATSPTQLALNGTGKFLNADWQQGGNYTGVIGVTGIVYTATRLGWNIPLESSLVNGDVVFWYGLHYQTIDISMLDGTSPDLNTAGYVVLPKSINNVGYITESDFIEYNLSLDLIVERGDYRRNVRPSYNIDNFQWGNSEVTGNTGTGVFAIINQLGTVRNCIITGTGTILNLSELNFGTYNGVQFGGAHNISGDLDINNTVLNSVISPPIDFSIPSAGYKKPVQIFDYLEYTVIIEQHGTNPPTKGWSPGAGSNGDGTEITNTLGTNPSFAYTAVGSYIIDTSVNLTAGKYFTKIDPIPLDGEIIGVGNNIFTMPQSTSTAFQIDSYNGVFASANDLIINQLMTIKIYF